MATDAKTRSKTRPRQVATTVIDEPLPLIYDRSSMPPEFMVTIPGQTEDDFFQYAPEKRFCELIDGIVYMPSPVDTLHQEITQFFYYVLERFSEDREWGRVFTGPAVLKLRNGRLVEPDVFVMPPGSSDRVRKNDSIGPAALIIEVFSSSNRNHDLILKSQLYRDEGIPEAWFVDSRDQVVVVERTQAGRSRKHRFESGLLECSAIPGFWIDVSWPWSDPLPKKSTCYRKITRGTKPRP